MVSHILFWMINHSDLHSMTSIASHHCTGTPDCVLIVHMFILGLAGIILYVFVATRMRGWIHSVGEDSTPIAPPSDNIPHSATYQDQLLV